MIDLHFEILDVKRISNQRSWGRLRSQRNNAERGIDAINVVPVQQLST